MGTISFSPDFILSDHTFVTCNQNPTFNAFYCDCKFSSASRNCNAAFKCHKTIDKKSKIEKTCAVLAPRQKFVYYQHKQSFSLLLVCKVQFYPQIKMFRMAGVPQVDAAEEKRRVRDSVKKNIFAFALLVAAIRIGKQFMMDFQ